MNSNQPNSIPEQEKVQIVELKLKGLTAEQIADQLTVSRNDIDRVLSRANQRLSSGPANQLNNLGEIHQPGDDPRRHEGL